MFLVFSSALLFFVPSNCAEIKAAQTDVPTVLSELLLDYDPSAKPGSETGPTHVNLSLHYGYVGYKNNELVATIAVRQFWNDERLRFKTPSSIKVRSDKIKNKIWTPDTFSPDVLNQQDMNDGFISISNHGEVKWSRLIRFRSPCVFDVNQAWLSDGKQNCSIAFSGYSYKSDEVQFHWVDPSNCVAGGPEHRDLRVKVVETHCQEEIVKLSVGTFSRVVVTVELQTQFTRKVMELITADAIDKIMQH